MLPVGGNRGGSLRRRGWKELGFEGRRCKGQGPAAFRGERDTSGLDWLANPNKKKRKPVASNKDITGRWQASAEVAERASHKTLTESFKKN